VKGSGDLRLEFLIPSISRERLELETSNLACKVTTRGTIENNYAKGFAKGSRNLLMKSWDPSISQEWFEL